MQINELANSHVKFSHKITSFQINENEKNFDPDKKKKRNILNTSRIQMCDQIRVLRIESLRAKIFGEYREIVENISKTVIVSSIIFSHNFREILQLFLFCDSVDKRRSIVPHRKSLPST